MTTVVFIFEDELLTGFSIKGHATVDEDDEQGKIVCAAVSSAAYMTANTITEIVGAKADITVSDGEMKLVVKNEIESSLPIMSGFMLHITELSKQYPDYIVLNTEV